MRAMEMAAPIYTHMPSRCCVATLAALWRYSWPVRTCVGDQRCELDAPSARVAAGAIGSAVRTRRQRQNVRMCKSDRLWLTGDLDRASVKSRRV